jgi:hypothetical protein
MAPPPEPAWCLARFWAPGSAAASWSRASRSPAPTRPLANGPITLWRGRARRMARRSPAAAAGRVASKPGSPAPRWRGTIGTSAAARGAQPRSRVWPRQASPRPAPRSRATSAGWPRRWPASSTCSIRTRSCSAAACRRSPACMRKCPNCGAPLTLAAPPRTRLAPARFGPESGLRGAAWLGRPPRARSRREAVGEFTSLRGASRAA